MISLESVTKTYASGDFEVRALDGVDLAVEEGEFVAIMGRSGSGKSTLMNVVGLLDAPTSGTYRIDGTDVARLSEFRLALLRNRKIGFIFQGFNLLPKTSALSNVELPLAYAGVKGKERHQRAMRALVSVGLGDRASHNPGQLSGGQQQRVAIARALVTDPALLLADEPTGNLDSSATSEVLDLFDALHAEGRTIVLITHEEEVASRAQRIIRVSDGRIIADDRSVAVAS